MTFKAKAKAKDSKFVLEDSSRPRTKTKENNTAYYIILLDGVSRAVVPH